MTPQPKFENLDVAVDDGVVTVTMNRPPVNAVSLSMYEEIHDLFHDIDQVDDDVRAVVFTGAGRHFCGGNDLDDFASMNPGNVRLRMFHVRQAFAAVENCAVPVVGAVAGAAIGTGLCLAAACDFVIAAEDASFGLPELSVGVMGGAKHLSRLVPQPFVRWMFFTGERVRGADLRTFGGCIKVVPGDELLATAQAEARRVAAWSPTAVRVGKPGLNQIEFMPTYPGYALEQGLTERMTYHPDSQEALRVARQGGKPNYQKWTPMFCAGRSDGADIGSSL